MKPIVKISSFQLVLLLLGGRLSNCLLVSSDSFRNFTFAECVISEILNGFLLLLLLLPTVTLLKKHGGSLPELAGRVSKPLGAGLVAAYMILCLFVLAIDIIQFSDFAAKTMRGDFSVLLLTLVFIGLCVLAAFYGVQTLARVATVVAVFSMLCLVVFSFSVIPQMRLVNFPPPVGEGVSRVLNKVVSDLPRTVEIAVIGLLYPHVNGSATKGCVAFTALTSFFSALAGITAVGVLGDYSGMTAYPYYTAIKAAQIGIFQRMDILVTAVWLGTFFIRFTLFSTLLLMCSCRLYDKKKKLVTGAISFAVLSVIAIWIQTGSYGGEWHTVTQIYRWALGFFALFLPWILWMLCYRRRRVERS